MKEYSTQFIDKLISKDKDTFNEFYLDSVDMFFRYIKGNYNISDGDAQDLLSQFYFKVWNGLDGFKLNTNFKSWVWTILKNTIIDSFKKSKDISFSSIGSDDEEYSFEDNIEDEVNLLEILETDFQYDTIVQAMEGLEDKYKDIVFLKLVEEKDYDEISEIMKISKPNARKIFSRAIQKLKDLLND